MVKSVKQLFDVEAQNQTDTLGSTANQEFSSGFAESGFFPKIRKSVRFSSGDAPRVHIQGHSSISHCSNLLTMSSLDHSDNLMPMMYAPAHRDSSDMSRRQGSSTSNEGNHKALEHDGRLDCDEATQRHKRITTVDSENGLPSVLSAPFPSEKMLFGSTQPNLVASGENVSGSTALHPIPSKRDMKNKSSSLLASSRKAGSKVVKATVMRPAKAVTRVFRGGIRNTSDESASVPTRNPTSDIGEKGIETVMTLGDSAVLHSTPASNGVPTYGTMNCVDSQETGLVTHDARLENQSFRHDDLQNLEVPDSFNWPVHAMESITRQLLLVCISYVVGATFPRYLQQVLRISEFAVTAWITCVLILVLSFLQRRLPCLVRSEQDDFDLPVDLSSKKAAPNTADVFKNSSGSNFLLRQAARTNALAVADNIPNDTRGIKSVAPQVATSSEIDMAVEQVPDRPLIGERMLSQETLASSSIVSLSPILSKIEHPALVPFFVVDAYTEERVFCNASEPHHISTEWFEMDMLCLIRTPDTDDPLAVSGTHANDKVSTYFRTKARRFEFQFRVKLKKAPVGKQVYFACELEEPIKMGIVTKAFVSAAMVFMKKTNPTFHYSITGSKENCEGRWEKPHMSFTVEGSLDRLVVTKPGDEPPKLGGPIHEDPESLKRRRKGLLTAWNTEDTYTMALWSSYVDFLDWKVLNLPGIRPFGLSSILGAQSISLTMYLIDENRESDKHYRKDITEIIKLELSNDEFAACGPAAEAWKTRNCKRRDSRMDSLTLESANRERSISEDSRPVSRDDDAESSAVDDVSVTGFDHNSRTLQNMETMEEIEEVDEDVLTAAALGEGIYLTSGASVVLHELRGDDGNGSNFTVANGGGFVVLQERDATVVIEKAKRSEKNKLIKSGDTVIFKMLQIKAGSNDVETRYLTIHRGWWLKWVTSVPTKNGFFTIHTHETELGDRALPTNETQSIFLTMGGSFTLRHKRWSKYVVGVAPEPSTTYGGRMLGLYNPTTKRSAVIEDLKYNTAYHSDEEFELDKDVSAIGRAGWLKPLVLSARETSWFSGPARSPTRVTSLAGMDDAPDLSFVSPTTNLIFSCDHAKADVPAWIEMIDRVQRARQLAYVVRVTQRVPRGTTKCQEKDDVPGESSMLSQPFESFMRLRTGRELAHVISIGQCVRLPPTIPKPATHSGSSDANDSREIVSRDLEDTNGCTLKPCKSDGDYHVPSLEAHKMTRHSSYSGGMTSGVMRSKEYDVIRRRMTADHAASVNCDEDQYEGDDCDDPYHEDEALDEYIMDPCYVDDDSSLSDSVSSSDDRELTGALKKGKKLLGRSAKLAKKTVVGTGKLTAKTAVGTTKFAARTGKKTGKLASTVAKKSVEQSKKVVKGTVKTGVSITRSTGKALIAPVTRKSSKPPKTEPKKKRQKEDLRVEVSKRMRKLEKIEEKTTQPPIFVAGELCAPEQSRRTASRVLSRMSNLPFMTSQWEKCNDALSAEVGYTADHDEWFLRGNAVDLGVDPVKGGTTRGELQKESLVARCLWESHWREEWCGMYESCVSFYAPLAKTPTLEIAYMDITNVRPLQSNSQSPLPGLSLLVLETAWLCHYLAFCDEEVRDTFGEKLENVIEKHVKLVEATASLEQSALRKARFWQGFQTLSESSLSSGAGKWAKLSSKDKPMERAVLNGRRMAFDCGTALLEDVSKGGDFVEKLLWKVFSFSLESLEQDPDSFIEFLDWTSQLRLLPLDEIDFSSKSAFCLFVNLYHCLLQQALLLSVNGPLSKKSFTHFMRTSCYEIGGDVFSLAELQCCVIRGKLSKPSGSKPPYIEPPKKSSTHRYYSLGFTDCRVHFLLNTGDVACPSSIPVLRPDIVDRQLNESGSLFLDSNQIIVDTRRRTVTLPKVCEVFKHDFGPGDSLSILKFCVGVMDEDTASFVRMLLIDEKNLTIKFHHTTDQYHSSLQLRSDQERVELSTISIQDASFESVEWIRREGGDVRHHPANESLP